MKATCTWAGALLGTALAAALVSADTYCSPVFKVPLPAAPNTFGPGFYIVCPGGDYIGPNYYLRPPGEPFNGPHHPMEVGRSIMAQQLAIPGSPPGQGPIGGPEPIGGPGPSPRPLQQPWGPNLPTPGYVPNLPTPAYVPNLPNYSFVPPNVSLPAYSQPATKTCFPYHPYVRSPRDFFMWRENMENQMQREQRPSLVP